MSLAPTTSPASSMRVTTVTRASTFVPSSSSHTIDSSTTLAFVKLATAIVAAALYRTEIRFVVLRRTTTRTARPAIPPAARSTAALHHRRGTLPLINPRLLCRPPAGPRCSRNPYNSSQTTLLSPPIYSSDRSIPLHPFRRKTLHATARCLYNRTPAGNEQHRPL